MIFKLQKEVFFVNIKIEKVLKFFEILGVILAVFSLISAILGVSLNSEELFNAGFSFLGVILPIYFVVFLLIYIITDFISHIRK